jgi:PleD family two-component response regulator
MGRPLPIHLLYAIFSIEDKMTSNQKTVMIIEDEADAAELFAEMMRINGFRVIKMFSSAPAIPIISQEKPDLDPSGYHDAGHLRA